MAWRTAQAVGVGGEQFVPIGGKGPTAAAGRLRRVLVLGDLVVLTLAAVVAVAGTGIGYGARLQGAPMLIAAVVAGEIVLHSQHLYRARVVAVRSVEIVGLMRTAFVVSAAGFLAGRTHGTREALEFALVVGLLTLIGLIAFRWIYQSWLTKARMHGRYLRRVVIVGDNKESRELAALLADHAELGLQVVGVVRSSRRRCPRWISWPTTDDVSGIVDFLRSVDANGVVIAATALAHEVCNRIVRELLAAGIHVHYSLGLRGISIDRVRPVPFAREPLFYLERVSLAPFQTRLKRAIDIVGSIVLLVLLSPFVALAAIAIKIDDGGPILFRQRRVGLDGTRFEMLKLRSMSQSATVPHPSTGSQNERSGGPLFKLAADPRRTRVGRRLERTSFDEVPQLINVLRGDMSLVGPRPALPEEVALFDAELQERHNMRPGITGLWQLEARDNPSFRAYRRLDLFYIENWSVGLDVAILFGTAEAVLARVFSRQSWVSRAEQISELPTSETPPLVTEQAVVGE